MSIELDIQDILGAGCLASIGRALSALSCLWFGAATGSMSVMIVNVAAEVLTGGSLDLSLLAERMTLLLLIGPLALFGGVLLPLFFPLVLIVYFTFARSESGSVKAWVIYASVTGLLTHLSLRFWEGAGPLVTAAGLAVWLGFAGSLSLLAFSLVHWQRRRMTEHFIGIAAENAQRRSELAQQFGTAVGDREFATGEVHVVPPPPSAAAPRPHRPLPEPPRDGSSRSQ